MTACSYIPGYDDALRKFDCYTGSRHSPVLVFIHGGAWKSEDKKYYADLARRLVDATGCTVIVPNYRLTPQDNTDPHLRHPIHARDILDCLNFLRTPASQHASQPQCTAGHPTADLILIGHSCSAHMLSSIFLQGTKDEETLKPDDALVGAVKGIIMSEGIYDLDALLVRFPGYRQWFIESAFGPPTPDYSAYAVNKHTVLRPGSEIAWLLLHSKMDTLVDVPQTQAMYDHLKKLDPGRVEMNLEDLDAEHDENLGLEVYVRLVSEFVSRVVG